MSQITWKNIASTVSGGSGTDLMESARKSLDNAFAGAKGVLAEQREAMEKGHNIAQDNLMADYLDKVAAADTVEAVGALREDAALMELRSQLTGDRRNQVRGAKLEQERNIINNANLRMDYEDKTRTREERPIVNQYKELMASGKYGEAQKLLDSHNLMNSGELALEGRNILRDDQRFEWDAQGQQMRLTAHTRQGELHQRQMRAYDEADAEKARLQGLEQGALNLLRSFEARQVEQDELTRQVVDGFGILNQETGEINYESLDAEQTEELMAALARNGVDARLNPTAELRDFVLNNPDVKSVAEQNALLTGMGTSLSQMMQLTPVDQARFDADLGLIQSDAQRAEERLNEEERRYGATNIFYEDLANTSQRLEEVAETLWGSPELEAVFKNSSLADVEALILDLTAVGYEIAPDMNITIPPALISSFIRQHRNNWFGTKRQMYNALGDWLTKNEKMITGAMEQREIFNAQREQYLRDLNQNQSALMSQYQSDGNIPQSTGAVLYESLMRHAQKVRAAEEAANAVNSDLTLEGQLRSSLYQ